MCALDQIQHIKNMDWFFLENFVINNWFAINNSVNI